MSNHELPINDADSKMKKEQVIDGIYNDVLENLRNFSGKDNATQADEDNEMPGKVLYDIWEVQNKVSKEYIEKIVHENITLKNDLRSLKSQFKLFKDKIEDILNLWNVHEQQKMLDNKLNIILYPRKFNSEKQLTNNCDEYEEEKTEAVIDIVSTKDIDEMNENLNKIRDFTQRNASQAKFYSRMAKKSATIKINPSASSSNKILLTDLNFKGMEALIEKLPRMIPEEFIKVCRSCKGMFGICRWKYHCRVCGYVYCFHCSNNYDNFIPFYMNSVRICDDCFREKKNHVFI